MKLPREEGANGVNQGSEYLHCSTPSDWRPLAYFVYHVPTFGSSTPLTRPRAIFSLQQLEICKEELIVINLGSYSLSHSKRIRLREVLGITPTGRTFPFHFISHLHFHYHLRSMSLYGSRDSGHDMYSCQICGCVWHQKRYNHQI